MRKYFITGLLILVPLAITAWVLNLVISTMDQSLLLVPGSTKPSVWFGHQVPALSTIPGLGTVLTVLIVQVVEADFFAWEAVAPLDLIYERAFLCAMPRTMWPQVAARWAQLLAPGAMLAGYFFFDDNAKGPPFGISREQLQALLAPHFDCLSDEAVDDSIAVFAGKERWMSWRRRAD